MRDEDQRTIVEVEAPRLDAFAGLMDYETVTPCSQGLALLKEFGERSPSLFALAERVGFVDPTHPGFKTNAAWLAFARHCSTCESCNEV